MKNYVKSLSFLMVVAVILNSAVTQTASNSIDQFIDAAKRGDLEEVRRFLGQNIRVDVQDADGNTALMVACMRGHENIARLLLEKGANTDLQNNNGLTALMFACMRGHENIARLLFGNGARVDLQDNNGSTALMFACVNDNDHENIVRLLLEKGARVDLKNNFGSTALMVACVNDNDHENIVRLLLEKGARVDLKNNFGSTALMVACMRGHENIARLLLEKGARVDLQNNNGKTALMFACANDHANIVRLLLEKGANTDLQDNNGSTALTLARNEVSDPNSQQIIELLKLYHAIHVVDVSQFPTELPDLKKYLMSLDAQHGLTDDQRVSAEENLVHMFETDLSHYLRQRLQKTYLKFQKGEIEPLRQFLFKELIGKDPLFILEVRTFFKSKEIFYNLLRSLAKAPKEVALIEALARKDYQGALVADLEKYESQALLEHRERLLGQIRDRMESEWQEEQEEKRRFAQREEMVQARLKHFAPNN